VLGEHHRTIDDHIEDAATAADQLRFDPERLLQLGRQTGGSREVVSLNAVFDRYVH
jgi:hypothetical protein